MGEGCVPRDVRHGGSSWGSYAPGGVARAPDLRNPKVQKFVYQKQPKSILLFTKFIVSRDEIRVRGGGGVGHKASALDPTGVLGLGLGRDPCTVLHICAQGASPGP